MTRIVVVGEGMVELARAPAGDDWRLGSAGDTLNTAVHLARLGMPVAFMTALGSDAFSTGLRDAWEAEGLDLSLVLTDPDRRPGLYAVTNDATGERHFTYWRDTSAARRLFDLSGIAAASASAARADLLVFSLISLAILSPTARAALLDLGRAVRGRGGRVAFDGNYRPALWADAGEARSAHAAAMAIADIGLPSFDDEAALFGDADPAVTLARWHDAGVAEVALKCGAQGCWVGSRLSPPPHVLVPVDTSGAGDAFNAAYLAARMAGIAPLAAAERGHRLGGWVVTRRGAVPALDAAAPYADLLATGHATAGD
ncbi:MULTISPECIES: sugar kinase [unclassified Sphingomonas]|nr:sugar kinase [Sphingomonas sp.]AXJ94411.1 sugar kinase [Sphingomonas sp. FARSPH]